MTFFAIAGHSNTKAKAYYAMHNVTVCEYKAALFTHTDTQRETHSISGYGPDPACVCTIQNNMEASSAAAIRAVPSAAPEEKKSMGSLLCPSC